MDTVVGELPSWLTSSDIVTAVPAVMVEALDARPVGQVPGSRVGLNAIAEPKRPAASTKESTRESFITR